MDEKDADEELRRIYERIRGTSGRISNISYLRA